MKAVILAATKSENLSPFVETRAKPMIRIAGKYMLESMIEYLREVGIRELLIVVNHKRETISNYFGYGNQHGIKIDYIVQDPTNGIGQALKLCKNKLEPDEHFLLLYGDVLSDGNIFREALKSFYESKKQIAVVSLPKSSMEYGNVYLDHEMRIAKLIEKPQDLQHSNYVFAGVFILSPQNFGFLEQNDFDMEQCYHHVIRQKELYASIWEGGWIDIIYPWNILEANKMMMDCWQEARIDNSVGMRGKVTVDGPVIIKKNVTIEAGTILKGPCYIGENSYIGNNSLIRSYSVLGPNTSVGYGTELKNCILLGGSDIGRLSFIGDSVVGTDVTVGTGTTTLNHWQDYANVTLQIAGVKVDSGMKKLGSFIGDGVNIGARHTLAPGKVLLPGEIIADNISLRSIF